MLRTLFTILFALQALCLSAQSLPIDFTKNPDKPLAIENPATGKTLFFFYPERLVSEAFLPKGNPWKAFEVDSKTLQVLRTGANASLRISESGGLSLRILCSLSKGPDYFFAAENDDKCRIYRIVGEDLSLSAVDSFRADKGMRIISGVAEGDNGYILCSRKSKKEGNELVVYKIGEGGRLQMHVLPESKKFSEVVDDIFKKSFKPHSVTYGLEEEPEIAARKIKLFAGPDKLWVTFDNSGIGTVYSDPMAILRVLTLDLTTDSLYVRSYYYTDSLERNASRERRSSYIFDNRLFQLYMNEEQLIVRMRDLDTKEPLFTKSVLRDDSISGFANSPILVPGRGMLGIEKEYASAKKFMRRFAKFDPFIQVRRDGERYLLCLGGHEEVRSPAAPGSFNNATGAWNFGTVGYSYEHAFSFYFAIDEKPALAQSTAFYKKPLIAAYADMLENLKKPRDPALYSIGGLFYLGYYDKDERQYRFVQIKNQ